MAIQLSNGYPGYPGQSSNPVNRAIRVFISHFPHSQHWFAVFTGTTSTYQCSMHESKEDRSALRKIYTPDGYNDSYANLLDALNAVNWKLNQVVSKLKVRKL